MLDNKSLLLDNEYFIISEVADNENITQRELSKKMGVSVSTVNILMNKMIREGLIKMTQVSQKQVLYMLTPVGMMEKAKKTVSYLKGHYRVIYETKEKIKYLLDKFNQENDVIYVLIDNDEMSEIISAAVHEFETKHSETNIKIIYSMADIDLKGCISPVLLHMKADENVVYENMISVDEDYKALKIVNLAEIL